MIQAILSHALVLFASAVPAAGGGAPGNLFCSTEPSTELSTARTRRIVREAEVVVRVVALGSATGRTLKPWDADTLAFEVREVLKGRAVADTLHIFGIVADWDDFQDGPIPYASHRLRYAWGACINTFYRTGAEYLLLLGRREGDSRHAELTPYWRILAPTNEQLRGPDDPWLRWVRLQISRPPAATHRRRRGAGS